MASALLRVIRSLEFFAICVNLRVNFAIQGTAAASSKFIQWPRPS